MESIKKLVTVVLCVFVLTTIGCVSLKKTRQTDTGMDMGTVAKSVASVPAKLNIATFDSGLKPNNLGGDFGAWDRDPDDDTQFCKAEFCSEEKAGSTGFSIKLIYDVDSPEPAYNGFWMKLEGANFTPYKSLVVSLKGDVEKGFTDKIKLELKSINGQVGKLLVTVTGDWQEKIIPLSDFSGISDYSQMTELVVVFDDVNSNPKTGVIYIDNMYVKK